MPSLATHYLFGKSLLEKVNPTIRNTILEHEGAFFLGVQGPDIFLYDPALLVIAKEKNIGKIMHSKKTDIYFYKYIMYLKEHHLSKNPIALSYFYGILCHYCLDCAAHPYVYDRTQLPGMDKKSKTISIESHFRLESDIDLLLYYRNTGKKIHTINRSTFMKLTDSERNVLSPIIAYAISESYKSDFSSKFISASIKRGLWANAFLNDKFGIKRFFIKNLERLLFKSQVLTNMIYPRKLPSNECLNEHHKKWNIPFDNEERNDSFMELYNQGLSQAAILVNMAYEVMNGKCSISDFIKATSGLSYHTGKSWRNKTDE